MRPSLSLFLVIIAALLASLGAKTQATTLYKDGNPHNPDTNPPKNLDQEDPPTSSTPKDNYSPLEDECNVNCTDRMEACRCPEGCPTCRFVLVVEELQTFTSYLYVKEFEELLEKKQDRVRTKGTMRTSAGDTYFLDGYGYTPTLPPFAPQDSPYRPPEYGQCYFENVTTERTFPRKCSTPITVDGATFRMFIGINGQIPGPTLIVMENQTIHVRVVNKLTSEGISVHWHGLHQRHTPWMDGVGFVTQPPIVAGAHFDYIFEANPPGTHWYHSHVGAQRTDGLYGALVIREKSVTLMDLDYMQGQEVQDRPHEFTLSLLDWQLESSLNLFVKIHSTLGFFPSLGVGQVPTQQDGLYLRTHSSDGIEVGPFPFWSGLINGRGRHNRDTFSVLSRFTVTKGESYRFRLIGAQNLYAFKFSIDNHTLDLIATDGWFVEKRTVDYIIIHTGERYDFILNADQPPANYWVRAETLEADTSETHLAEAILYYNDPDVPIPDFRNKYTDIIHYERKCLRSRRGCLAVNCPFENFPSEMNTRCFPLDQLRLRTEYYNSHPSLLPQPPRILKDPNDKNYKFFNFGFEGKESTSAINAINSRLPTTPYQTYCKQFDIDTHERDIIVCENASQTQNCIHVSKIAANELYEDDQDEYPSVNFVLSSIGQNQNNNFSHPIHLHGHAFRVVAVRYGKYDSDMRLRNSSDDIDCDNFTRCKFPKWTGDQIPSYLRRMRRVPRRAILKDTVIVPAGGYVVIAFQADNPGYWFMHCHIEAHQLEGMSLIVQEYDDFEQWAPPDQYNTVGNFDINKVGNFTWMVDDYRAFTAKNKMCHEE